MAGVARVRPNRKTGRLNPVVMNSEFSFRRSSLLHNERAEVEDVRNYEDLLPALHQFKRVLILGEPGIGKTTTLFKFADELRRQALDDPGAPVPVIVPLREWHDDLTWENLIEHHLGGLAHRYDELLAHHRLYLLLDGLNEIPGDGHHEGKLRTLRHLLGKDTPVVVTCRELDYRDERLRLDSLDTIGIHPLAPERVLDFLRRYLVDSHGEEQGSIAAENLFWQIGGGKEVKSVWEKWRGAGASLNPFFSASDIPRKSPDVYGITTSRDDDLWRRTVKSPTNLMHLAANPYLLWMFLNIYLDKGTIPANRGALFDDFVFYLFRREGLTEDEVFSEQGEGTSRRFRRTCLAATSPSGGNGH